MSSRWYPIFKPGNPQLRVFLPNFWMKVVRNDVNPTPPSNVVTFHCSMEMTEYDIRNYLTKIYKIPVVAVHTEVRMGEFFRDINKNYVKKKDDFRVAVITMPADRVFEFPELFDKDETAKKEDETREQLKDHQQAHKKFLDKNKDSRGSPPWFSF